MSILLIINPNSGSKLWEKFTQKYYDTCNIFDLVIFKSKYKEHIYKFVEENKQKIQNTIHKIIVCGGDGMLHLTIQSLFKNNLETIPIGIIPAGTGNGIWRSIVHEKNLTQNKMDFIKSIQSNTSIKLLDILHINNTTKCILGITWGIISDIDIQTEYFRKCGSIRYYLGALYYIIKKKSYNGKLIYTDINNQEIEISGKFLYFWACNSSYGSEITCSSPYSKLDDGYVYISYVLDDINYIEYINFMLELDSGKFIHNKKVHYIKTKQFQLITENGIIVVDGEKIKEKELNVKVVPKKIKFIY